MNRPLIIIIGTLFDTIASFAQGQVVFANKVGNLVDAPVVVIGSSPIAGPGQYYTAQLNLLNPQNGSLTPLLPTSLFQKAGVGVEAIADRYWSPVLVDIPGVASGQSATFVVRAWATDFGSFEGTRNAGWGVAESAPFTVTVGGGLLPPANLTTLQSFAFTLVPVYPEPSTILLGCVGGVLLFGMSRRRTT